MKKYTKSHHIGDVAEAYAVHRFSRSLKLIYRRTASRDTGVDGEIELTGKDQNSKNGGMLATGQFIKVQIKGTVRKPNKSGKHSVSLTDADLEYLRDSIAVPTILVLHYQDEDENHDKLFWKAVNKDLIEKSGQVSFGPEHEFDAAGDLNQLYALYWFSAIANANKMMCQLLVEQINRIVKISPDAPEEIRKAFSDRVERWFRVGNELGIVLRNQLGDHIGFESKLEKIGNELLGQLKSNFELFSKDNLDGCLKDIEESLK